MRPRLHRFVILVVAAAACAHVPTAKEQVGLAREATGTFSKAFRVWYVAELDKAETTERVAELRAVRQKWDAALKVALAGLAAAEAAESPAQAWTALTELTAILKDRGIPIPEVRR